MWSARSERRILPGSRANRMLFRARSSARATFATSSRKSTFGMGADFADNRPIVGTELGQRLGQSKGFHTRPDRA
jgi:hypothetical protein